MGITNKNRRFKTISQLEGYVRKDVDDIAEKVLRKAANEINKEMTDLILEWYAQYQPQDYTRTYQLMSAATSAQSDVYKTTRGWRLVVTLFDMNKMSPRIATVKGNFDSYIDFKGRTNYGGKPYTKWVVEWVDEGGIRGHSPINYEEEINKLLEKKVHQGILTEMRKAGYKYR